MCYRILLTLLTIIFLTTEVKSQTPPTPTMVSSLIHWPGVNPAVIDPAFVVGTTGQTLGDIVSFISGAGSRVIPAATSSDIGGVTVPSNSGLAVSGGALSVVYGITTNTALQGSSIGTLVAPIYSPVFTGNPVVPGYETTAAAALLAPLMSAALVGTPTAPTATVGSSNQQIANTTFVSGAISNALVGTVSNSLIGASNGVAPLNSSRIVPNSNLPITATRPTPIVFDFPGVPSASQQATLPGMPWGCTIPAGGTGSTSFVTTLSTGSVVFTVSLNRGGLITTIGNLTFTASNAIGVWNIASSVTLSTGDGVYMVAPSTPDATWANGGGVLICN